MSRGITSTRSVRHGGITALLTALVVTLAILANAILAALAVRYSWYVDMNPTLLYPVTDTCYQYLDDYIIPPARRGGQKLRIIFCDEEKAITASPIRQFVYHTAVELKENYPDLIEIEHLNIWERPSQARAYEVTSADAVVFAYGEEFSTCALEDFFVFSAADTTTPLAYCGEKRFAVAMKTVVDGDAPACYFTLNHGESFPDYSLMFALADAGYRINYLDALSFDIPEDCKLLVTFNPTRDFTDEDGVSGYSEVKKLENYMANGGAYMVFASADTFAAGSFDNLEGYLDAWGVRFDHHTGEDGIEQCFSIKDPGHALTPDGYTILAKIPEDGSGAAIMADIPDTVRLGNATGISPAEGFTANADGDLQKDSRTRISLLTSFPGAEAWVGGRAVDRTETGYDLVTLTRDTASGGHLLVCASVDFAEEEGMQSSAYGNGAFLMTALSAMGKTDTPAALKAQPFADTTIHTLTTAQASTTTVLLAVIPTAIVLITGTIVLIRRKFA